MQVLSAEWEEHWIKAVTFCKDKVYNLAEQEFNSAIQELESAKNIDHPHVYVDRAKLYALLDRNQEALNDANKGLESSLLKANDILRARNVRFQAFSCLGMEKEALNELEELKKISSFPKMEVFEHHVIVRDVPDCECSRKVLKAALIAYFCSSEEDIQFLPGAICVAKRTKGSQCFDKKPQEKNELNTQSNKDKKLGMRTHASNEGCYWCCDKCATVCTFMCPVWFKSVKCRGICVAIVEGLRDTCHWCCGNNGFYENCIKPFEDVVGQMGNICDPAWD